ncbi:MAG: TonB-dependent receptor, partial [Bacteroidia bacterium]|nr:TonB-dependent receptor [Bacteroidia bacterium]
MRFLFFIALLINSLYGYTQTFTGKVYDFQTNEPLAMALVRSLNTDEAVFTNDSGYFTLTRNINYPFKVVFSLTGYVADTLLITKIDSVKNVYLRQHDFLKEVVIEGKQMATQINKMSTINMQTISAKELVKAACCNLSESFENSPSVDVNYTDAATGAKQIQMLGLDGIYTQITSENFPAIRGLSNGLGLALIPGPYLQSIQVSKGAGSVVNGYESISGAINIEYQKPETAPSWFFNAYQNQQGRSEININKRIKFNDKWSWLGMGHYSTLYLKNDFNKDGFLDQPLGNQVNLFNRVKYQGEKLIWQAGVKIVDDNKIAGQVSFNPDLPISSLNGFGIKMHTKQVEAFSKTGFLFPKTPYRGIGVITTFKNHNYNALYGNKNYTGNQQSYYVNVIYQDKIIDTRHTYKTGISFLNDMYNETFLINHFTRTEIVPGAFFEYAYIPTTRFSLVAGVRADAHNLMGNIITPRLHVKYDTPSNWQIRASVGTGQRMANWLIENPVVLASARVVNFTNYLQPEKAFNTGISLTKTFELNNRDGSWVTDYFYTKFSKQTIADLEVNPNQVFIVNSNNLSFSHAFQSEINYELIKSLDVRLAYKYYDVRAIYNGVLNTRPFVPKNRALLNIAYATRFDIWKFDFTTKYFGETRIPATTANPAKYQLKTASPNYIIFNAQITRA